MMRKVISMLCAILLLTVPPVAAAAETGGSLRLDLEVGELPVTNGAFTLYRVGTPVSDGYRIEDSYGGGFVRQEDALSPHLAQWMNESQNKQGTTILMDVDGNAVFSSLEDGLYLLVQTELTDGFYPIQPFLMTIPCEGRRNVSMYLEPLPRVMDSPPTGQDPAPYIGLIGMALSLVGMVFCTGGGKRWKR